MGQFREFEDILAWKESRVLIRKIRAICKETNARRDYAFVDQITRSCRSISANIAEGNDCLGAAEFIKFLGYAKRSAAEVRSHLYDALDDKYVSKEEFDALQNQTQMIQRMIAKLIHHLQSLNPDMKRTFKVSNKPIN